MNFYGTNPPYRSRYTKLLERRTDRITKSLYLDERVRTAPSSETVRYVLGAMLPVDPTYTANTIKEADRVQNQLERCMPGHLPLEFAHQGSVTNDTHIRLYSDIDLLALTKTFHMLKLPLEPTIPWTGDPLAHLADTRKYGVAVLKEKFPEAEVDTSKGKAIGISGGSLSRSVDVVVSNWFNTYESQVYGSDWRGIHVYDSVKHELVANFPFLHNRRIHERDWATYGNVRKLIRLVKSVKADADRDIDVSSYDITGLVWNMPDQYLAVAVGDELKLVTYFYDWGVHLLSNPLLRAGLKVPNGSRDLFGVNGLETAQLQLLLKEIELLLPEVKATQFYGLRTTAPRVLDLFREQAGRR